MIRIITDEEFDAIVARQEAAEKRLDEFCRLSETPRLSSEDNALNETIARVGKYTPAEAEVELRVAKARFDERGRALERAEAEAYQDREYLLRLRATALGEATRHRRYVEVPEIVRDAATYEDYLRNGYKEKDR